ncbi:MAG: regulatory inactivation of DnaA Hda protein [Micavibrio sp.]|nr:MAG: regulatory inactivation of DnaA Hda protein [Micavibrio sp.]
MRAAQQIPFDLQHRTALGREDFLIAPSNEAASLWVDRWPNWPAPLLILSGPASSGKSHLAAVWQELAGAQSINPEMLISKSAEQIAQAGEHIVIDSIDPWLGERAAETALFHLYNILKEEQRSLLVTMRMAPSHTDFAIADLASRWRAAPVAVIDAPDDMLLASVLIKLFSDRQLIVSNDVIQYVLPRMERSFSAAHDIVTLADRLALAEKRRISVPLMRRVLVELQEVA